MVERLTAAWSRGAGGFHAPSDMGAAADGEVTTEPRRRTRTPLTEEEVDAMRTAHDAGISVTTIARQFDVHRGTVWAKIHI